MNNENKKTTYQDATKIIERKEQLQSKLDGLKASESSLRMQIHGFKSKVAEQNRAVNGREAAFKLSNNPHDKAVLNEAISHKNALESESKKLVAELENVEAKQLTINSELLDLKAIVNDSLIIEHQSKISEVTENIRVFDGLIEKQQAIVSGCSQNDDGLLELSDARQEILTDIALGNDRASSLAEIDKKIASLLSKCEKASEHNLKVIHDAQQTIAGLNARKTTAHALLADLDRITPPILGQYTKDMALIELEKYKKAAKNITGIIEKINHLDKLISQCGDVDSTGVLNVDRWDMKLPLFNGMTAIEGTQSEERFFANISNLTIFDDSGLEAIKASIQTKGIRL